MNDKQEYLQEVQGKLLKALGHLEYSYNKILSLPTEASDLDEEALETWESFIVRFSRVADIFLVRYTKVLVLISDPGFQGSLRDFVNQGEKLGIIDDANAWMSIREFRNITAHEYNDEDLSFFWVRLREECPRLLNLKSILGTKH